LFINFIRADISALLALGVAGFSGVKVVLSGLSLFDFICFGYSNALGGRFVGF